MLWRMRRDDGFTLIELLIVIIILGILATIVIFATGTFNSDSKTAACKSNAKIMNTAESAYAAQHGGTFPHGDMTKLSGYLADPIPTTGNGSVAYNSATTKWECA